MASRLTGAARFGRPLSEGDIVLRVATVALTLATAYIHATLGGLFFTLNALGYLVGAAALIVPVAIAAHYRWLVRIGLAAYAATSIAAWVIQPTYYSTAYLAKVIELALIAVLAIDFIRRDGNPIDRIRQEMSEGSVHEPSFANRAGHDGHHRAGRLLGRLERWDGRPIDRS